MTHARKVGGKKPLFGVVVMNDNYNSFDQVIATFQEIFNWDITQAGNCANIIHNAGEYAVKWFESQKVAMMYAKVLMAKGLSVKIISNRNEESIS